jgi:hypothetical protein
VRAVLSDQLSRTGSTAIDLSRSDPATIISFDRYFAVFGNGLQHCGCWVSQSPNWTGQSAQVRGTMSMYGADLLSLSLSLALLESAPRGVVVSAHVDRTHHLDVGSTGGGNVCCRPSQRM